MTCGSWCSIRRRQDLTLATTASSPSAPLRFSAGKSSLPIPSRACVKITHNTSAVTVHGVTRDESERGVDEPVALEALLDYLKDGVIVGHHIGHDIAALNAAYERNWNLTLSNRWIDTLLLSVLLQRDGVFAGQPRIRRLSLEALGDMFQVIPHDRHTAAGDAFITAQIFLRLLRLAVKAGRNTLAPLGETAEEEH